jgi:hypothetical protein
MVGVVVARAGINVRVNFSGVGGAASMVVPRAGLLVATGAPTSKSQTAQPKSSANGSRTAAEPQSSGGSTASTDSGSLRLEDVVPGLAVQLIGDSSRYGAVLSRRGASVRVNWSASGGKPSQWTGYDTLALASVTENAALIALPAIEIPSAASASTLVQLGQSRRKQAQSGGSATGSPPDAPSQDTSLAALVPSAVVVGMLVSWCGGGHGEEQGVVLKRDRNRLRVDFSASGGPPSKWLTLDELTTVETTRTGLARKQASTRYR